MIKTHHLEYVFYSESKISKSVAIINIFIINNGTFLKLNLIKIIHQNVPDCIVLYYLTKSFPNFLGEHDPEPPSLSVADIIISI